jgi:hypothetical protein
MAVDDIKETVTEKYRPSKFRKLINQFSEKVRWDDESRFLALAYLNPEVVFARGFTCWYI